MRKETAFYKTNYLSVNTLKSYMTGIRAFVMFMLYFGFGPCLPVSDEHLAQFVVFLARSLKPQSIKQYLFGVRAWHLVAGFEFVPWSSRFPVWRAMQGIRRVTGEPSVPKLALTADILMQLQAHLVNPWNDPKECVLWCAMLVAYFGMLSVHT